MTSIGAKAAGWLAEHFTGVDRLRAQEIGIRLALGAGSGNVRNIVVLQGIRLAFAGVVVGIAAAMALTRLMEGFVFRVKAWGPGGFHKHPGSSQCGGAVRRLVPRPACQPD